MGYGTAGEVCGPLALSRARGPTGRQVAQGTARADASGGQVGTSVHEALPCTWRARRGDAQYSKVHEWSGSVTVARKKKLENSSRMYGVVFPHVKILARKSKLDFGNSGFGFGFQQLASAIRSLSRATTRSPAPDATRLRPRSRRACRPPPAARLAPGSAAGPSSAPRPRSRSVYVRAAARAPRRRRGRGVGGAFAARAGARDARFDYHLPPCPAPTPRPRFRRAARSARRTLAPRARPSACARAWP